MMRTRNHPSEQHYLDFGSSFERLYNISAVAKNFGGFRKSVACSNAYANLSNVGSLHARPKKDIPTGNPDTNPAGTVTLG
jgi:hypothetical protein